MNLLKPKPDGELLPWTEIAQLHEWAGILTGNGASLAVWDEFRYGSLYDTACRTNIMHRLEPADLEFFDKFSTRNFEAVLDALSTTQIVNSIIGTYEPSVQAHYLNIQYALFEAASHVHLQPHHKNNNLGVFKAIRRAMRDYDYVFSTNYDLIIYWSIMSEGTGDGFKDYFWSEVFDPQDVEIWGDCTRVLYLHGGIHLARSQSGQTIKRRCDWESGTLLQSLWVPRDDEAIPLFITEGKSQDKLGSISRSEYLSFAYDQLEKFRRPLVIFGHSLGESDSHLLNAIRRWGDRPIAVSLLPNVPSKIKAKKYEIKAKLPETELYFFDSTSHPLGAERLKIDRSVAPEDDNSWLFSASRRTVLPWEVREIG